MSKLLVVSTLVTSNIIYFNEYAEASETHYIEARDKKNTIPHYYNDHSSFPDIMKSTT